MATRRYAVAGMPQVRAHVIDVGMACCAVEFVAAVARGLLLPETDENGAAMAGEREDADRIDGEPALNVLIVSGTVTHALLPAVVSAWNDLPEPRAAVAFGACTISGGPYWDSYAVAAGMDAAIPVVRYVPGCPPRPEALIEALTALAEPRAAAERVG